MPRPLREQLAGATYHLMARGVRGAPLTMGEASPPAFLSPRRLLTQFGLDAAHSRASFSAFMREAG